MFKKIIILSGALMLTQVALADDNIIDSVSLSVDAGQSVQMTRLSFNKDWDKRWFQSNGSHLGGYWQLSTGFWREKRYMNQPGLHQNLWDIGLTPVFRYEKDNKKGVYYEAGVGVHYLSKLYNNNGNYLSTRFQFGPQLGVGYVFENNWDVGLRAQHFSNAGKKEPNSGVNFISLKVAYHF